MDLFVRLFLIAVVKGVDDAFADGHADAVAIVFAETGGLGDAQTHLLRQIDALHLRLQRDFEVFLVCGHAPLAIFEGNAPQKPQLSVTQRKHTSQWRERCSAAAEFPDEQGVVSGCGMEPQESIVATCSRPHATAFDCLYRDLNLRSGPSYAELTSCPREGGTPPPVSQKIVKTKEL